MIDVQANRDTSSEKKAKEAANEQQTHAKVQDRESREQTPRRPKSY
jgi:hypothetical protein